MSVAHETTIAPVQEHPGQMHAVCSCGFEGLPTPFFPLAEQQENVHLLHVGGAIAVRSAMTGGTRIVLVDSVAARLR